MHRIAQDFSGYGRLGILSIGKPAPDQRSSQLPVQEPPVLFILLILCIHVHKNRAQPRHRALACSRNLQLVVKQPLFHPRMIYPVVGGGGQTYLEGLRRD